MLMLFRPPCRVPLCLTFTVALALVGATLASGETVVLEADRDNTLYETPTGSLSNGAGRYLFVGKPGSQGPRRALVHFDVSDCIPFGSTVTGVTLNLTVSRTRSGNETVNVHRVLGGWGEGSSNASGAEGRGTSSSAGDATWVHTFFPGSTWTNPGGDFDPVSSASATVGAIGSYSWSDAGLVQDVQGWLDNPGTNDGWILIGREGTTRSAKRFDSSESPSLGARPSLTIEFTLDCSAGTVNAGTGVRADVFFVNGSAGTGPNREVIVGTGQPIEYSFVAAPLGPAIFEYVLWIWRGTSATPTPLKVTSGEVLLGCTINPTPLDQGLSPQPKFCIQSANTNPIDCRGTRRRSAPDQGPLLLRRNAGFANERCFQIQGLIEDNGALNGLNFSVTNLVTMKIVAGG